MRKNSEFSEAYLHFSFTFYLTPVSGLRYFLDVQVEWFSCLQRNEKFTSLCGLVTDNACIEIIHEAV